MYIVIEKHGGWEYATICCRESTGENAVFDTLEEAQDEVNNCLDGIIVGDNVAGSTNSNTEESTYKYVIKEMYEAAKNNTSLVHIEDLICKILNIKATFLPNNKIIGE